MTELSLGKVLSPHMLWYMTELFDDDGIHLWDFGNLTYVQTFRNSILSIIEGTVHYEFVRKSIKKSIMK